MNPVSLTKILMNNSVTKALLVITAIGFSVIAIELIPVSRQSLYWNRCIDQTNKFISKIPDFQRMSKKARDSLSVSICNGAVHEPRMRTQK